MHEKELEQSVGGQCGERVLICASVNIVAVRLNAKEQR